MCITAVDAICANCVIAGPLVQTKWCGMLTALCRLRVTSSDVYFLVGAGMRLSCQPAHRLPEPLPQCSPMPARMRLHQPRRERIRLPDALARRNYPRSFSCRTASSQLRDQCMWLPHAHLIIPPCMMCVHHLSQGANLADGFLNLTKPGYRTPKNQVA